MKFRTWSGSVDPDQSFWTESGDTSTFFLNVIRLFYEVGPPAYEQIGILLYSHEGLSLPYELCEHKMFK